MDLDFICFLFTSLLPPHRFQGVKGHFREHFPFLEENMVANEVAELFKTDHSIAIVIHFLDNGLDVFRSQSGPKLLKNSSEFGSGNLSTLVAIEYGEHSPDGLFWVLLTVLNVFLKACAEIVERKLTVSRSS